MLHQLQRKEDRKTGRQEGTKEGRKEGKTGEREKEGRMRGAFLRTSADVTQLTPGSNSRFVCFKQLYKVAVAV
jgi:hypothetical protein